MIVNSIFTAYSNAIGGQDIILTLLAFPFLYTIAYVFYRIAV